jgi:hypothetical protein
MITESVKKKIQKVLKEQPKLDLVSIYLVYLEINYDAHPVLFPANKTIYLNSKQATDSLGNEGKLWRETEIIISYDQENVNKETRKIYICPFSGKAFGNNTHPNPQDAIYDWVSNCPENKEIVGGLKVKRFYVSEDPDVIKNYVRETQKSIKKKVFSSVINGKLFNSKDAVIQDFTEHYLKSMTLTEVQSQNRFQMHFELLQFFQTYLNEERIGDFINNLSNDAFFTHFIKGWMENEEEEPTDEHSQDAEA